MKIYKITFDNYEGIDKIELYHNKEHAESRMESLRVENQEKSEYEFEISYKEEYTELSFFDPAYNEYSTFIYLEAIELESLFYD